MDLPGDKDIVKIAAVLDFPSGPVVKTLRTSCRGHGFDPWSWEVRHAALCGQKQSLLSFARTLGDLVARAPGWCQNSPGVSAPLLLCGTEQLLLVQLLPETSQGPR